RQSDDGWAGGIAIGRAISPTWNLEWRSQYEQLDITAPGGGEYKNWSTSLDAQWFFLGRTGMRMWGPSSWQPYLVGGLGAINNKTNGARNDDQTGMMATAGLGVVWPFSPGMRMVFDARYR